LFSINFGKKIFKNTFLAVLAASLLWGYAHSNYPVFPMWFRGLEVTILGIFISFIYLRYGIITVLVGHYLFDVFWGTSSYILGKTQPMNFYSSIAVLLLPAAFALFALIRNKKVEEKPMRWHLSKHGKYNLEVLKQYLLCNQEKYKNTPKELVAKEIISHGWDIAVVETALEDLSEQFC